MDHSTKTAKLRPRARLISLIGDELISDEIVAVIELVKNAYDADADVVDVKFEVNESHVPIRLTITDDGHGMSLATVLGSWFEPGTVHKKKDERSPDKKRMYQGAKGVGRFAAARLGDTLLMETKCDDEKESTVVLLEWGNFDDDSYLDEVEITYETAHSPKKKHGTTLTVEGLNEKKEWTDEDFENLHYRLARLISPFTEVKNFSINLDIPTMPELTGEVEAHDLTRNPEYSFTGTLSVDGKINGTIFHKKKELKPLEDHPIGKKGEVVGCGPLEFEIRAWDRDREGLASHMLAYDMNISTVRKILDSHCGVSIYRDGFRVHPYGERGNDWLSLDTRSRQNPTVHLANNQIIASIKTSRTTNPGLIDRTTREGLVFTPEFKELNDWVVRVLQVLEGERYRLRPRDEDKPEYTTTLYEVFDMSDVVGETNKQLGSKHPIAKLVKSKDDEIRDGVKKLQEHYSRVLMAAGLGQLVDLVIHEVGAPLGRLNREMAFLKRKLDAYEFDDHDGETINKSLSSMFGWLEQIANLRGRLDPKTAGKRGRATSFRVDEEIEGNIALYENLIAKQKITVKVHKPKKPVIVHMSRSVLGQIIANLLDNSVFWLTRHYGDGNGGTIDIRLKAIKGGFTLTFCDDGPGVDKQDYDRIFDQYFSLKPNGMGLGLYIARQVIEHYGKLTYLEEGELTGACFRASFTNNVGV